MHARIAAVFLLLLAPTPLFACSSETTVVAPAGPTDTGPPRIPKLHRSTVTACPTDRPAGTTGGAGGKCATDAECTAGKNGRCIGGLTEATCTYDECVKDEDCGTAVCECRDAARLGAPNVCFRGNCRTDADCNGGYCSPSGTAIFWNCLTGVPLGSLGYFCHTKTDECVDKEDCGSGGNNECVFDTTAVHWKCIKLECTR